MMSESGVGFIAFSRLCLELIVRESTNLKSIIHAPALTAVHSVPSLRDFQGFSSLMGQRASAHGFALKAYTQTHT